MHVYMLRAHSDHFQCFIMPDGDLFEFAGRFNGRSMKRTRIKAKITVDPSSRSTPKGDYPSLIPGVPVFSRRAVTSLSDLLEGNGQVLPVQIGHEEYFLFNATRVVDALDESQSKIIRFPESSEVLNIRSHFFFKDKIVGLTIFKIPQVITKDVFVTDVFVERVHSAGLKGFWFPVLWSSE